MSHDHPGGQCIAKKRAFINRVLVAPPPGGGYRGKLVVDSAPIACALGRRGISRAKREGDGTTPAGTYHATNAWFRADRLARPASLLPIRALRRDDGWCDDPASGAYNRPVRLPFRPGHEDLWRQDHLYDVILALDHNQAPRIRGGGSAIFVHMAGEGYTPTAGCIALARADMLRLLPRLSRATEWVIG